MNNGLTVLEKNKARVLLTKQLADVYGASEKNINDNFSNNKERFEEGKHYYLLKGQDLKDFKNSLPDDIGEPLKFAPKLILWTERGADRHCKILDTDEKITHIACAVGFSNPNYFYSRFHDYFNLSPMDLRE